MTDQVLIQVRVEEALKTQASAILNEVGLTLPTAIRVFLKTVIRNGGIPDSMVQFSSGAPSDENSPAVFSSDEYANVVAQIPRGKLIKKSDLIAVIQYSYKGKPVTIIDTDLPKTDANGVPIPYWRIISERGTITGAPHYTRHEQELLLIDEGHEVITTGAKLPRRVVADYQQHLLVASAPPSIHSRSKRQKD